MRLDDSVALMRFSQTPIHDEGLSEFSKHDVARLQIAMEHASVMRVGNSIAGIDEVMQDRADLREPLQLIGCASLGLRRTLRLVWSVSAFRPLYRENWAHDYRTIETESRHRYHRSPACLLRRE